MTSRGLVIVACAGCICLLAPSMMLTRAQDSSKAGLVEVSGLRPSYTSCELVSFAVKNISQQELYVEVYAEKFESTTWTEVDFSHDIRDPKSLYIKRMLINPKMLKPRATEQLTWDRCLRPAFIKEADKTFRRSIIEKDSKSDSPILQRLRVDTYVGPEVAEKSLRRVYSETFKRITNKQSTR
jgi:hypothetical protein